MNPKRRTHPEKSDGTDELEESLNTVENGAEPYVCCRNQE